MLNLLYTVLWVTSVYAQQKARVIVRPGASPNVGGALEIIAMGRGIIMKGKITGLTPGFHGFHIHEKGGLGNSCKDAGGHFNPFQYLHGSPQDSQRHVGDLGNIRAGVDGTANIYIIDRAASMDPSSRVYIGNRAVVIHADPDDLGRGQNAESRKTGNAGARVGCGIIEIQSQSLPVALLVSTYLQPSHVIPFQIEEQEGSSLIPLASGRPVALPSQFPSNIRNSNAYVRIIPGSSQSVKGRLDIAEIAGGITIKGTISGLTPGFHGFHIHEKGDLGNECRNAGGHFNPFDSQHGDPDDIIRHVGDLGNIKASSSGIAYIDIFDPKASLDPRSPAYVGNRAMVVHADRDDLGRGGDEESKRTGNAGARVGCGVIELSRLSSLYSQQQQRPITFPFTHNFQPPQRTYPQYFDTGYGY